MPKNQTVKRITSQELLAKIHFGDTLFNENNYTSAIDVYSEVLSKIASRNDLAYDITELNRKIGDCYYILKENMKAAEYYENTLKYYTNNRSIYETLGRIFSQRDLEKSLKYYTQALRMGANESFFTSITWLMMNNVKHRQKEIKETFEYWVDKFKPNYLKVMPAFVHGQDRKLKDKKLNVAYVSTDFYCHAMMSFMLPILENHNTKKYNFTLYMLDKKSDAVTERIKKTGMNFVDLSSATVQEIAQRIYDDKIDVVIDLAGWVNTKAFWLIYKPAPVQMQYLGFLQTYGMKEVDYILADEYSIPPDIAKYYTEKPMYIKHEMQKYCFSHPNTTVPPCDPEPPCVKNGYITFGCFNTLGKIDNYTAKLWSRLLKEIPNAKLLIYRTQLSDDFKARISEMLEQNGADMQRVMFRNDKQSPHFLIYGEADIALDPVPFSGLTVTIETILMGVPVLCKKHETLQSKGTSRVNYSLGLDELVAEDEEDFIAKAKRLADVDVIKKYRESLRYKLVTSSIFTDYGIAADFEDCIDRAWQEWCK